MGVALFGTASLYALDPGFAAQAEIQRQASNASSGSSCSGSSGTSCSSSSSSCSGGSSSSCGGGSSCGGAGMRRMTGRTGSGIGWRPEIAGFVAELPGLRFVEVVAESVAAGGPLPDGLAALRERGVAVVPHGVRLSLGGAEPVDPHRVAHLARWPSCSTRRWSASTSRSSGPAASRPGTCCRCRAPGRR